MSRLFADCRKNNVATMAMIQIAVVLADGLDVRVAISPSISRLMPSSGQTHALGDMATEVQALRSSVATTQSALAAAGRDAAQIADLFTVMTVGALIVWAAVVAIAVYTIRVGESHSQRAASLLIIGGGVVAPTLVLGALIAYGMPLVPKVLAVPAERSSAVHVTAKQWWWRTQYPT